VVQKLLELLKLKKKSKTDVDNIKDFSGEKGIPGIDLTEGLTQIKENNELIDSALGELLLQVDKIKDKALSFQDELAKQKKFIR